MSLSVRLLLLMLLAAAPILAIQTARELERRRSQDAEVTALASHLADLAAAQQDSLIEGVRYTLTALAALAEANGRDGPTCSQRMREFHSRLPAISWLGAVDEAGDLYCSSHPADRPLNLADREYVAEALAESRFAVSGYLEGRVTGQRQLAFALPAPHGGAVLAAVNLDALPSALSDEQLPPGAALSFHDRNGVLLARTPARRELVGRPAPIDLVATASLPERSAVAVGLDGVPRLFAVASLRSAPELSVLIGVPFAEAEETAESRFRRDLTLVALAFGLAAAAALAGAQLWLRRPLQEVQRALDQAGRGDFGARAERRPGQAPEIASLAAGFNAMARALQARDESLRESERRFADIAANLPGVVYRRVLTPDGKLRYDYMSEGVRKLLGQDPEPFRTARTVEEHAARISPADRAKWVEALLRSARTLEPFELAFRAPDADGAERWLRSAARPRREADGSIVWDGVTLDITERIKAERALQESESRFRDVAEATADVIWETDAEHRFSYFSDQLQRLTGVDKAALLGRRRIDVIAEAAPPSTIESHLADLAAYRPFRNFTYWATDILGRRCFSTSGRPIFDQSGAFRGYRGTSSDVTDRILAQEQMAWLAAIVDASRDAIIGWSLDGRITSWNREAERLYGYSADEAIGAAIEMLTPPDRRGEAAPTVAAVARSEWFDQLETVHVRKDGALFDVSLTISPVRDSQGRIIGGSTIVRDISERKRAETRQLLLLAELDHRVKNMLAVLIAIFQATAQRARSLEDFTRSFEGRLMALMKAHDALAQNKMEGASLRALALSQLSLFCDRDSGRLRLDGDDVVLSPKAAQTIGMALHELGTNAAKHGALSAPEGVIELSWRVRVERGRPELVILWRERGGPPIRAPAERGFGRSLLERGIAYELGGSARLEFRPEGVVWEAVAPLESAEAGLIGKVGLAEEVLKARPKRA